MIMYYVLRKIEYIEKIKSRTDDLNDLVEEDDGPFFAEN